MDLYKRDGRLMGAGGGGGEDVGAWRVSGLYYVGF